MFKDSGIWTAGALMDYCNDVETGETPMMEEGLEIRDSLNLITYALIAILKQLEDREE